jgi:hypothetical protein
MYLINLHLHGFYVHFQPCSQDKGDEPENIGNYYVTRWIPPTRTWVRVQVPGHLSRCLKTSEHWGTAITSPTVSRTVCRLPLPTEGQTWCLWREPGAPYKVGIPSPPRSGPNPVHQILEHKQKYGTTQEKALYAGMGVVDLIIHRFLEKRAITFCGWSDFYKLRSHTTDMGGWKATTRPGD